jgi:RNA-directed DNA polymerase
MGREFHVRFREGLGVQLPRATRLVIGFTDESDARRVMEVLPKRFGKYGLSIHPDKTRLVPFVRPQERHGRGEPESGNRPGTFDFLGFTHY